MIQRVYEQALKSTVVDKVYVATDSEKIADAIRTINGEVVMTTSPCKTGTDRVADAARSLALADDDIVINIQGDQPLLEPKCLNVLVEPFLTNPKLPMATLAIRLRDIEAREDPNNVKVIMDADGLAIYFSRATIPFDRDGADDAHYYKHLGIYAYTNAFLQTFTTLPPAPLEQIEKLEQLRAVYHGHKIAVTITPFDSPSVDDKRDIKKTEALLQQQ